jgi:hypothetical protein
MSLQDQYVSLRDTSIKMDALCSYIRQKDDETGVGFFIRYWLSYLVVIGIMYYIFAVIGGELFIGLSFFLACLLILVVFRVCILDT